MYRTRLFVATGLVAAALGSAAAGAAMMHPTFGAKLSGMGEHGIVNFQSNSTKAQLCWTFNVTTHGATSATIRDTAGMVVAKLGPSYKAKSCVTVPKQALDMIETNPSSYRVWVDTKAHMGEPGVRYPPAWCIARRCSKRTWTEPRGAGFSAIVAGAGSVERFTAWVESRFPGASEVVDPDVSESGTRDERRALDVDRVDDLVGCGVDAGDRAVSLVGDPLEPVGPAGSVGGFRSDFDRRDDPVRGRIESGDRAVEVIGDPDAVVVGVDAELTEFPDRDRGDLVRGRIDSVDVVCVLGCDPDRASPGADAGGLPPW